jgi:UDP-N-acetylmuramate: L-alanyl-gamma-D-glutamyl-meso-diaminopimelate ligase
MNLASKRIYFLGLGGIGMGGVAIALKKMGIAVSGCDRSEPYDPMKTALRSADISISPRWDVEHLSAFQPDLVIVGNTCTPENLLVKWTLDQKIPFDHMAKFVGVLSRLGHTKHHIVVAGTHGKTTTSFLLKHVLQQGDIETGSFIGGFTQDNQGGVRLLDNQSAFVYEGDEYDCAFFDKQPKFMYYGGNIAILTACEHDHVDLYPTLQDMIRAYQNWLEILPPRATVWISETLFKSKVWNTLESKLRRDIYLKTFGRVTSNFEPTYNFKTVKSRYQISYKGKILAKHDIDNIHHEGMAQSVCVAYGVGEMLGLNPTIIQGAIESFPGVKRRNQLLRNDTITVIDDFAHHPTAVYMNLEALRRRYPGRRLCVVFEPRSATARRNILLDSWKIAFKLADLLFFAPLFKGSALKDPDSLNITELCTDKTRKDTYACATKDMPDLLAKIQTYVQRGDVWILFSNGDLSAVAEVLKKA